MKKNKHSIREVIIMAWDNVRTQSLRTGITASIIAIGITALVGILTSVAALKASMTDSFKSFGAGVVNIYGETWMLKEGTEDRYRTPNITYHQALRFKEMATERVGTVSISGFPSSNVEIKSSYDHTDPNVMLVACDENYMDMSGYKLEHGRGFTLNEINSGGEVAIIGPDLMAKLFPNISPEKILGMDISISGRHYSVIGVSQSRGAMMGVSQDNIVFIPFSNARAAYPSMSVSLSVSPLEELTIEQHEAFMDEIRAVMRNVRSLTPSMQDNFDMRSTQSILQHMDSMMGNLKVAALIIGLITILGSSIALMNIMLVSVTERTREIGTMKAIGASPRSITIQFLLEAVMIGQIGGVIGIVLGILIGNVVSMNMDTSFVMPWSEMLLAFVVTFTVGVLSGYYPARKAARLDPIEALRYE